MGGLYRVVEKTPFALATETPLVVLRDDGNVSDRDANMVKSQIHDDHLVDVNNRNRRAHSLVSTRRYGSAPMERR